jgi:hypothetical protein
MNRYDLAGRKLEEVRRAPSGRVPAGTSKLPVISNEMRMTMISPFGRKAVSEPAPRVSGKASAADRDLVDAPVA